MVMELQTRLAFRRQVNALGVGMSLAEALPPRDRALLFRLTWWLHRPRNDATGSTLGVWLSHTFAYDAPPPPSTCGHGSPSPRPAATSSPRTRPRARCTCPAPGCADVRLSVTGRNCRIPAATL